MDSEMAAVLITVGRVLLGGAFAFAGIRNIVNASWSAA